MGGALTENSAGYGSSIGNLGNVSARRARGESWLDFRKSGTHPQGGGGGVGEWGFETHVGKAYNREGKHRRGITDRKFG